MTYKFRAWHHERRTFYEVRGFLQGIETDPRVDGVYCAVPVYGEEKKITGYAIERFEFEVVDVTQALGFKDAQGVEVYEADIIEAKVDTRFVKRLVISSKAFAGYEIEGLGIVSKNYLERIHGRVVGNVYQNGELLTGRQ